MIKNLKIEIKDHQKINMDTVRVRGGVNCTSDCVDKNGNPCGTGIVGSIAYGLASCQAEEPVF